MARPRSPAGARRPEAAGARRGRRVRRRLKQWTALRSTRRPTAPHRPGIRADGQDQPIRGTPRGHQEADAVGAASHRSTAIPSRTRAVGRPRPAGRDARAARRTRPVARPRRRHGRDSYAGCRRDTAAASSRSATAVRPALSSAQRTSVRQRHDRQAAGRHQSVAAGPRPAPARAIARAPVARERRLEVGLGMMRVPPCRRAAVGGQRE